MPVYRVGHSLADSTTHPDEQTARDALTKTPGAYAWRHWPEAREWELCRRDCATGQLFTVHELEIRAARGGRY